MVYPNANICVPIMPYGPGRPWDAGKTSNQQVNLDDEQNRLGVTKMIMKLFDRWALTTSDQLELLGLSSNSRRMLSQYRKGKAIPNNRDILDRMSWLLVIHQDLRTMYPENPEICYSWVKRKHGYLQNSTPLEVMIGNGLLGIFKVAQILEYLVEL